MIPAINRTADEFNGEGIDCVVFWSLLRGSSIRWVGHRIFIVPRIFERCLWASQIILQSITRRYSDSRDRCEDKS